MNYENPKIPEGINVSEDHPLKEFALLVSGLSLAFLLLLGGLLLASDYLSQYIPFSWEQKLASYVESTFPTEEDSFNLEATLNSESEEVSEEVEILHTERVEQYLQSLIVEITQLQEFPEDEPVTLHYVQTDVINAFATIGNHIFVFSGLLSAVPNENALFMVLAHEASHLKQKHPIRALGRGVITSFLLSIIGGITDGTAVNRHFGGAGLLTVLSFSRDQEREADLEAFTTLANYYGHASGATDFFEYLLSEMETGEPIEMLNTHPLTSDRIKTLSDHAKQHREIHHQPAQQFPTKPLPDFVLEHIASLPKSSAPESTQQLD